MSGNKLFLKQWKRRDHSSSGCN